MANYSLARVVWRVSLPIIFVEATEIFDHVIDTIFLARVGVTELGAIAVADAVLLLFLVLPLGVVDGIQILTARRVGQRRPEAVGAVFNQGLLVVLLLCMASTATLKLAWPVVAEWLIDSDQVGVVLDGYIQIDAYSLILTGVTFAYSALLTSLGRTRALVPATIIFVVADLVLNYLFIFGKFGCPELGMRGAAVGSIGAEFVTIVFLTACVLRLDRGRFGFFRFRRPDHRITSLLSRISAPIVLQGLLENLRWFVFFLILERVSAQALAIANIVYTCYIVFGIPAQGFSETSCSMVSRFTGRNKPQRIGRVLRETITGAILATVPLIVAAVLVPKSVLAVFSPGAEIVAESTASLRVVALAMLIIIPGEMWLVAVLGTGDTTAALGIELVLTITMLGLTYFLAIQLAWSVTLIWFSLPIAWLVCLALSYGWVKSGIWKRLHI